MSKIKFIITLFFSIPIAAFFTALFILDNPDTYREALKKGFYEETKLNLSIDGDISWRYWPPIAMDISRISITPDQSDTTLATLDSASIDIQLLPLLTGGRFSIKTVRDKQGKGNWEQKEIESISDAIEPSNLASDQTSKEPSSNNLDLDILEFVINDAQITYQDLRDESHYILSVSSFTTNSLRPDNPADIKMIMSVDDRSAGIKIDTNMEGTLSFNKPLNQFKMTRLSIKNTIAQEGSSAITSELMVNGMIDTRLGTARLDNGTLSLATMTLSFSLNANNIFDVPGIKGSIAIPEFNAIPLLKALDIPLPQMQNSDTLSKLSLTTNFKGTTKQIVLDNLFITLDNSNIDGRIVATVAPRLSAEFALHMDTINLSDYMEVTDTIDIKLTSPTTPTTPTNETAMPTMVADSEVIPVSLLSEMQINGAFDIDTLRYDDYQFDKLKISVINQQAGLRINAQMAGYGGEFALKSQVRNIDPESEPNGRTTFIIKDVDMALLTGLNAITGTLAMDSTTTFTGNRLSEVLASLDGDSNFTVSNGTLNVEAIKGIAAIVDGIQGKTSSLSTWPDQLPFKILQGKHSFKEGITEGQQFSFVMENMQVVGSGGLDYFSNSINYDIEATLKENVGGQFTVGKNLAGIRWPLHCEGSIDGTVSELCLANKGAISNIVTEIAKQAIRRKGEDKLLEKVPDEFKDAAKQLLKGLFN